MKDNIKAANMEWMHGSIPHMPPKDLTQEDVQAIYDGYSSLGKALRNYLEPWFETFPVKHGKEYKVAEDAGDWDKMDELYEAVKPAISIVITPDIVAGWGDTPYEGWTWLGDWTSSSAFC